MSKVTVDRDELATLLEYAESEIETRISCLKDSGDDRAELESEISDGQETLAAFQALLAKHKKTDHLRRPYYSVSDGVVALRQALNANELKDDVGLRIAISHLSESLDALYSYMNAKYLWD